VAGIVSLLLQRRPGQTSWPETTKSAIVASTWHDIEAGTDRDGQGSPIIAAADDTYRLGRFRNDSGGATSFPRTYNNFITGVTGQVKVATSWDSQSTGGAGTDVLGADLDLQVRRMSDNALMCSSASFNNAIETCTFSAVASQSYRAVILRFSSIVGWTGTFLGTAWSLRNVPNPCTAETLVSSTPGIKSFPGLVTVHGSSYFDNYPGNTLGAQNGKERYLRLTLPTTRDLTISDTNGLLDLHVIRQGNCAAEPWTPLSVAHGANVIRVNNAPAGTYHIVVDGRNGAVGVTNLTVRITGP
jgi:hypothetical protein